MKTFSIKPINNGRVRFDVLNQQGFLAVRKKKTRWGLQRGASFVQVHVWRYSLAIEHNSPHKPLWTWAV